MRFYNEPDDCTWLRETALRGYTVPDFQSFTLQGHEDCPLFIELYEDVNPMIDTEPVARYELVTGNHDNLGTYHRMK